MAGARSWNAEVLLVDDGSVEPWREVLRSDYPGLGRVDVLELRRNLGHQRAISIALAHIYENRATDAVVVMDGNGEDEPESVPRLLEGMQESGGGTIVFARRTRRMESLWFKILYQAFRLFHRIFVGHRVEVGNFSVIPCATYVRTWDGVIGLEIDGNYIAVPHNVLWWHEIVNFSAFSTPLAVTYCPLTGSGMVFDRTAVGGAEFGVSGLLFQNNLLLFDRSEEQSLWPHMMRGARCGPRDGQMLDMVPSIKIRWEAWVALHPETKVISIASSLNRNYQLYPYGDYESLNNPRTLFPQGDLDDRRPPKERVLGIPFANGGGLAFPFESLDAGGDRAVVHARAEGEDIVVFWDHDSKVAVAFQATLEGQPLDFDLVEGRHVDVQTGSEWTLDGRAISSGL